MDTRREPVIVSAARTPVGRLMGALAPLPVHTLGGIAIKAACERAGIDPATIEEVIMGDVVSAGVGQAPARQAAIKGGVPASVGALTVNKVCGSGLKAAMLGAQAIKAGDADIILAGGMESMSNAPYLLARARSGYRYGNDILIDSAYFDGLYCSIENQVMGLAAEFIAEQYDITRQEMDEFSLHSHQKAIAAIDAGKFKAEIVPVEVPAGKKVTLVDTDEGPRRETSMDALAKLKPAFKPDGRVTAGNSPGLNDGAAAVVLMSREKAEQLGKRPLARIVGYAQAAVEPKWIFIAPARAVPKLLDKIGWKIGDVDLFEVNEAFSAQVLADGKDMQQKIGWDWSKVNVNGGAVALGHPIGCSGARVLTTLIYALKDRGLKKGIATLCLGGGEAVAMAIEIEG
jgi:acetyl-CoA C-acetyltransferase